MLCFALKTVKKCSIIIFDITIGCSYLLIVQRVFEYCFCEFCEVGIVQVWLTYIYDVLS